MPPPRAFLDAEGTRVPQMFGNAAARLEGDIVWGIFIANARMADGTALFHVNHKNVAAAGSKLSVDSIGKGRTNLARQTGIDGKTVLNIRPSFLIVPASLELAAEQLIAVNLVPAKSMDAVPASIRTLAVIAEPRLDDASTIAWYLAADPAQIDTIEYAYLEGQIGVHIETRMGFVMRDACLRHDWTASRSRPATTSPPRPSTGGECTRIQGRKAGDAARPPGPLRSLFIGGTGGRPASPAFHFLGEYSSCATISSPATW